jgi:hypothetical protein
MIGFDECMVLYLARLVPSVITSTIWGFNEQREMTMKMKSVYGLLTIFVLFAAGCSGEGPSTAAAVETPVAKGHMNMLQLMRSFPFPHANVVFSAQSVDPEGAEKTRSMAFSVYRWGDTDVYAGWPAVESSALALAEMAPILLTPRDCANGLPAPVDREDWKKAVDGLVAAGEAANKAAQSKNQDAIVEVSETITTACAACHDIYRDVDQVGKLRCSIPQ